MASQVEIYNMALAHIGVSQTVASLEERSKERIQCSAFWTIARDTVLADFNWPFATRFMTLAQTTERVEPWLYVYQYPTDCLRALYIADGTVLQPDEKYQSEFATAYGESGQVIYSNEPGAVLAYVVRVDDTGRFPPLFTMALSLKLASLIAMPLTATQSLAQSCGEMYKGAAQEAWAAALNEAKYRRDQQSEFIRARG